jgi:hypothetical protein
VTLALTALALVAGPSPVSAVQQFEDDFESGNLSNWDASAGLNVQQSITNGGSAYAARSTASKAWAAKDLASVQQDLFARVFVNVRSQREEFHVLRFRKASGQTLAALSILNSGRLRVRNYVSGKAFTSTNRIHRGWNDLQMRVFVNGRRSRLRAWLDGDGAINHRVRMGSAGTGTVEIGNRIGRRRYTAVYDDVTVDTQFIRDITVLAAGNIACDPNQPSYHGGDGSGFACHMKYTSNILVNRYSDAVLALGDNQYICGGHGAYNQSYDQSWGRVYNKTYPVPGDKEYRTTENSPNGTDCEPPQNFAEGYEAYFGSAPGPAPGASQEFWYSFELGNWHIVALNSACGSGVVLPECGPGSAELTWLVNDLANSNKQCTLVFFHHPRFSSGTHGNDADTAPFWNAMYDDGVELVLNAHDHTYERFLAQDPQQNRDRANGIVEFVVGSGGHSHEQFPGGAPEPNSAVRNALTFGVLEVALRASSWRAEFIPEAGSSFTDSATGNCH